MESPDRNRPADNDITDDLSTLFANLLPSRADQVQVFLESAAEALRVPEAGLAREIGITRATLSSWKARQSIPAKHLPWFQLEFVERVVFRRGQEQHAGMRHAGIPAALELFRQTDFDPFGLRPHNLHDRVNMCFDYLEGIACLCLFIQRQVGLEYLVKALDEADGVILTDPVISPVARITTKLLRHLRQKVSQSVSQSTPTLASLN
jgi:hypothetical protein